MKKLPNINQNLSQEEQGKTAFVFVNGCCMIIPAAPSTLAALEKTNLAKLWGIQWRKMVWRCTIWKSMMYLLVPALVWSQIKKGEFFFFHFNKAKEENYWITQIPKSEKRLDRKITHFFQIFVHHFFIKNKKPELLSPTCLPPKNTKSPISKVKVSRKSWKNAPYFMPPVFSLLIPSTLSSNWANMPIPTRRRSCWTWLPHLCRNFSLLNLIMFFAMRILFLETNQKPLHMEKSWIME